MPRELQESLLDKIEKNDSLLIPVDAEDSLQNVDYPDYMFILENTAVGDSPLKEGVSPELLEHTLGAFDVRYMIWYLDRFEYERIEEIDHCMDWKFNQKDYMTCIMFDYPSTVREQVKFIIQMMSVYWMSYWGYSDVLMYKYDGEKYIALLDGRTSELVAAANDIAGFAFYLTHSDAKRSFQYEGEELKKLKHKICAMLPDNSSYGYQKVSKIIDQMLRVRKRRLKKYRHCGDSDRNNVKWRPIVTESVLDDIGEISTDSAEQLATEQTENPLDYQFLYLIGIRTAELDVDNICTVCEMFGLRHMLIIYNRHELQKQEYVDWVKMSHLPDDEYFLFLFIDKLPDTLAHRIQFMLKIFTIILQELDEDSISIFRFDKVDDIFKMEKGGRIIKTWYKGYFGQYAENRKSYDDTFFTSQFATLVNTTNHIIYNQCDAELRKIRDRILAKKSATRLDESVLDDIDGSDMKLDDVVQATAMPDELCYDYMFMFDIKNAPYNPEKIYDMSAAMGVDVRVNKYGIVEDDFASIDYIDHSMDVAHKTRNILAIFVNLPASDYRKALFIIQLLRRVWNIYDAEPNVWAYKRIGKEFKYVCQTGKTLSYIQATFKWNTIPTSGIIENLRSDIEFIIRKINNDDISHRDEVQKALMHILSASVFRTNNYKKSVKLQESVLDDIDGSDIEQKNVLVQKSTSSPLDYSDMFLFNTVRKDNERDNEIALSRIQDLGRAMGIDVHVEDYNEDDLSELDYEYLDYSFEQYFQTDYQVCVYVNPPKSDYQMAKFFFALMRLISKEFEVSTDIYVYHNPSGEFFDAERWKGRTMLNLDLVIGQEKLNANNNQTMNIMSYGPTIYVYQDVCDILGFETPDRKLAVERALKNLLKQVRLSVTSGLNESVLDDLRLQESILDDVEQTFSDSASRLKDLPTSVDTNIERFERFPRAFMFHYSYRHRFALESFLNTLGVDYELLDVSKSELDNIDWIINNSRFSYRTLILFVELPTIIFERARLLMRIISAIQCDYSIMIDMIYIYNRETESGITNFVTRSSASAIIGTTSNLNNYFNGGPVYNNKSARTIETFISIWKNQFTNLLDYGTSWSTTLNKLDIAIGKLDRRRQKLLNVKRNHLEQTSI